MKRSTFSITRVALLFAAVISLTCIGCEDIIYDPLPSPPSEKAPILLGKWVQLPQTGDVNLDTYLTFLPGGEGELTNHNSKCAKGGVSQRSFMWISLMEAGISHVQLNLYREIICGDTLDTDATELHHYYIENDTLDVLDKKWIRR
jgi:hypothetical protein